MAIRVILVGAGNMGFAMLAGWLDAGTLAPAEVAVVEPAAALRERAATRGVRTLADASALAGERPELVVLAVKPQVIRDVAAGYRTFAASGSVILSIAAGVTVASLTAALGGKASIVRCMPNTPAAIGKGMMVTFAGPGVPADSAAFVARLLAASGEVASIPDEGLMDAVTAVSGSGPAYIFHFIEALTKAAESVGLEPATATLLARQTVYGAAALAFESGEDAGKLREQVTSPNGTTAAALKVLMGDDVLTKLLTEAVIAARDRGIELGK
ncbi:MAG: pyrroline-5-carboxylate reductase [Rhizobiaceae bacterium]|nr:pyrroline-5-carboxylate reductase [Rhizobiaceae bacterium]